MNDAVDGPDILGRRIGASLLDFVVLAVLFVVVGLVSGQSHSGHGSASVNLHGVSALVWLVLALAYYFVLEALFGQTLGKRLLGIRVVARDGGRPSTLGVAARTVLRIVDALPLFYLLGFVVILGSGRRRQRIGDFAGRTTVRAT